MGLICSSCLKIDEENECCSHACRDYRTPAHLQKAFEEANIEQCELILGIDFTSSNSYNGSRTFDGRCLHSIDEKGRPNPYIRAMELVRKEIGDFDDDKKIPCYGFGDAKTTNKRVFPFFWDQEGADGFDKLIDRYKQIAKQVKLDGPTTFAPLIRKAQRYVTQNEMRFHILLIIADGEVTESEQEESAKALREASASPMAIVAIGVGDGPWDKMKQFEKDLKGRKVDNFQFVELEKIEASPQFGDGDGHCRFRLECLKKIPEHYRTWKSQNQHGANQQ